MTNPKPIWPLVITFPAAAPIAVPAGHWRRSPDGKLIVLFQNRDELETCLTLSKWINDERWGEPAEAQQSQMFPRQENYYYAH